MDNKQIKKICDNIFIDSTTGGVRIFDTDFGNLTEKQKTVIRESFDHDKISIVHDGISGTTIVLSIIAVLHAIHEPNFSIAVKSTTLSVVRSILDDLEFVFDLFDIHVEHQTRREMIFNNGSSIFILAGTTSLRGQCFDMVILDNYEYFSNLDHQYIIKDKFIISTNHICSTIESSIYYLPTIK